MRIHKFNAPREVNLGDYKIEQHGLNAMLEQNFDKIQTFLDNEVVRNLQFYVRKDTGAMENSIKTSPLTIIGGGQVAIDTPYAAYQAYSPKVKKPNNGEKGQRGKYPFERMVSDKKDAILNDISEYSRRLF